MPDIVMRVLQAIVGGLIGGTVGLVGYRLTQGVFTALRTWIVHQFAKRLVNRSIGAQSAQLGEQLMELRKLHDAIRDPNAISLPGVKDDDLVTLPVGAAVMYTHTNHLHFAVRVEDGWRMTTRHMEEMIHYTPEEMLMVNGGDSGAWLVWQGNAFILSDAPEDANTL